MKMKHPQGWSQHTGHAEVMSLFCYIRSLCVLVGVDEVMVAVSVCKGSQVRECLA